MIHTREQLIHEIEKLLNYYMHCNEADISACAEEIADLIASLDDPNQEWKNVP